MTERKKRLRGRERERERERNMCTIKLTGNHLKTFLLHKFLEPLYDENSLTKSGFKSCGTNSPS